MSAREQAKNDAGAAAAEEREIANSPNEGGAEKPRGFFSEDGAPLSPLAAEKPGGFFSTQDAESEEQGLPVAMPPPAPLARGGRPTVLTPQIRASLCQLLSVGLSRRQAAAYVGIAPTTITHAAARDEDFAADVQRAEELAAVKPLMSLIAASRKNWRAAAWFLKNRALLPVKLSEVEKDQELVERLADARRQSQLVRLRTALTEEERQEVKDRNKARELAQQRTELAEFQADLARRYPRRKKRVNPAGGQTAQSDAANIAEMANPSNRESNE